jgi:hypothetical protein
MKSPQRKPNRAALIVQNAALVAESDGRRGEALALTHAIRDDFKAATGLFWQIGDKLQAVVERKLFGELGYSSFAQYLANEFAVAATQAYKMIRVVRNFVQKDAERVGLECADMLIPYAKQLGTDPGLLVREDALIGDKPVSQSTVRDLRRALRGVRGQRSAKRARTPAARQAKKRTEGIVKGLRASLAEAKLGRPRITVTATGYLVQFTHGAMEKRFG